MGVNWVFAPVADVNNNPDNPIINIRSYGENPQEVSSFVQAYIAGAHSDERNRVMVTAKHFPGHGDTAQDSHSRREYKQLRLYETSSASCRYGRHGGTDYDAQDDAGRDPRGLRHRSIPFR